MEIQKTKDELSIKNGDREIKLIKNFDKINCTFEDTQIKVSSEHKWGDTNDIQTIIEKFQIPNEYHSDIEDFFGIEEAEIIE